MLPAFLGELSSDCAALLPHCSLQEGIISMVQGIKEDTAKKEAAAGSPEYKRIAKRVTKRIEAMNVKLRLMFRWELVHCPTAVQLSKEALKAMLQSGLAPAVWQGVGVASTRLHFGRLYHTARSNLERCHEELKSLALEKARLIFSIKGKLSQITAALAVAPLVGATDGLPLLSLHARGMLGSGKVMFLCRREKQFKGMLEKVQSFKEWPLA